MARTKASVLNQSKSRKRVEPDGASNTNTMVRARDGSAFVRCEGCNKDVSVVLISMHSCSLDAKIKTNLESQVVEQPAEDKKKPAESKKVTSSEPKAKKSKTEKKPKSDKKPKRPPTAFFLFMDDFRKVYKEANPDSKSVKEVAKQGGEKWKSMTDEEKMPYIDKAAELKAEHAKALESNNSESGVDEGGQKNQEADDGAEEFSNE